MTIVTIDPTNLPGAFDGTVAGLPAASLATHAAVTDAIEAAVVAYVGGGVKPDLPLVIRLPLFYWDYQDGALSAGFRAAREGEPCSTFSVTAEQFDEMARLLALKRHADRPPG